MNKSLKMDPQNCGLDERACANDQHSFGLKEFFGEINSLIKMKVDCETWNGFV